MLSKSNLKTDGFEFLNISGDTSSCSVKNCAPGFCKNGCCTRCVNKYYVKNNTCVPYTPSPPPCSVTNCNSNYCTKSSCTKCLPGYTPSTDKSSCRKQDPPTCSVSNCKTCKEGSPSVCKTCNSGYKLDGEKCKKKFPWWGWVAIGGVILLSIIIIAVSVHSSKSSNSINTTLKPQY